MALWHAPKVSVIIPSYNGARYVAEAAGSILDQSYRDLELVVVDDGSGDETRQILRALAAGDRRMRLIEKDNEGLIPTLNRGIAEARGRYIARLDHDDVSRPERIARQAAFLDSHRDHVGVGCLLQNMQADGTLMRPQRRRYERLRHDPAAFPPRQQWLYGPTPMFKTDVLRRVGGYRAQFLAAEDRDLCWRMGAEGPMERLPEVLVNHRHHTDNMSRTRQRTQIYSALLSDLSAIAAHYRLDDRSIVDGIDVGGDYAPTLSAYRALLRDHYPIDSYVLFYQMRSEIWNLPDHPPRADVMAAVLRHVRERPIDPVRIRLFRRWLVYQTRKPRGAGGHRVADR